MNLEKLRNMRDIDVVLANPNRRPLGVIEASNIRVTLRLSNISECTMEVQSCVVDSYGRKTKHPYYAKVQTKRLIHIDNIGWFKIMQCTEKNTGSYAYKEIRCCSLQRNINNYGFFAESKPYLFFDKSDPEGRAYRELEKRVGLSPEDAQKFNETMPSVVGELHQQLHIQLDPRATLFDDSEEYYFKGNRDDWTIEYISPALRDNVVRSFDDSNTFSGYEWIQNQASVKFECLFLFDFERLAIRILTVSEVTKKTNIFLDYQNVVNELHTNEKADDIVTVLNVDGGNGLNIQPVSPTGTNYIANFDYYKYDTKKDRGDWMSKELTIKLNEWENEVREVMEPADGNRLSRWEQLVLGLRNLYQKKTEIESDQVYIQKKFEDLKTTIAMHDDPPRLKAMDGEKLSGNEIFTAEEVSALEFLTLKETDEGIETISVEELGDRIWKKEHSFDPTSEFFVDKQPFKRDLPWKCYQTAPKFVRTKSPKKEDGSDEFSITGLFVFEEGNNPQVDEEGNELTFDENYLTDFLGEPNLDWRGNYVYFVDTSELTAEAYTEDEEEVGAEVKGYASYCKLVGEVTSLTMNEDGTAGTPNYHVSKFVRYNIFTNAKQWEDVYKKLSQQYANKISEVDLEIEAQKTEMERITSRLNLEARFDLDNKDEKKLYKELRDYWYEGKHTNDGFCLYDNTTPEAMIDLARELYADGTDVLSRISQPSLSISVDAIDFTKIKEFDIFARELELGKVITICKSDEDRIYYYPALTTINLALDSPDLTLEFSNSLRPDSSNFRYTDLVKKGVEASRSISANSREWSSFARKESTIDQLLYDPLNRVLRIAHGNMTLQDVVVDNSGILLRKFTGEEKSSFDPRQARLLGNVMIFTNDSWQTAKTALGEITFPDPEDVDKDVVAYGLMAEALIGSLIIGETLYIKNKENTITLKDDGITIEVPVKDEQGKIIDRQVVFHADNKGDVRLVGHIEATSGSFKGHIEAESGKIGGRLNFENGVISSDMFTLGGVDENGQTSGALMFPAAPNPPTTIISSAGVESCFVRSGEITMRENSIGLEGGGRMTIVEAVDEKIDFTATLDYEASGSGASKKHTFTIRVSSIEDSGLLYSRNFIIEYLWNMGDLGAYVAQRNSITVQKGSKSASLTLTGNGSVMQQSLVIVDGSYFSQGNSATNLFDFNGTLVLEGKKIVFDESGTVMWTNIET